MDKSCIRVLLFAFLFCLIGLGVSIAYADSYQTQRLLEPQQYHIIDENKNQRVYIYSYIPEPMLDRVLDEQFDRLEHMMFVNIQHNDPQENTEDCD